MNWALHRQVCDGRVVYSSRAGAELTATLSFVTEPLGVLFCFVVPWDCFSSPLTSRYKNSGLESVYLEVGRGDPGPALMGYTDPGLQKRRSEHLSK